MNELSKAKKTVPDPGVRPRPRRISLPFEKRKTDPGTWFYEHRVGICVTVIAYLIFGIIFISAKIVIYRESHQNTILIDLSELEEQKQEITPEQIRQMEQDYSQVLNRISDENAVRESDRSSLRGQDEQIDAQSDAIAEKLRASREMYQKGLKEEQDILNSRPSLESTKGKDEKTESVRVKGSVMVSFSLAGRTGVYLHNPGYQCEGGGTVVIAITVNRNGKVTAASVSQSSNTSDPCMTDRALASAKRSRFNASATAPDRQQGTITYQFIPQ